MSNGGAFQNVEYAGKHLLGELWGVCPDKLRSKEFLEWEMEEACEAAKATVLSCNFHDFDGDGITGVILLAESHMSIHTWPSKQYAAVDIFMCGDCDPMITMKNLINSLTPKYFTYKMIHRGIRY